MDEHARMLACKHTEADQLGPFCLSCGRIDFDPSVFILAFAALFFGAQAVRWFGGLNG